MQNTYHHLATVSPKMRSITGIVSFTDSTVYSESIGCEMSNCINLSLGYLFLLSLYCRNISESKYLWYLLFSHWEIRSAKSCKSRNRDANIVIISNI